MLYNKTSYNLLEVIGGLVYNQRYITRIYISVFIDIKKVDNFLYIDVMKCLTLLHVYSNFHFYRLW